jgi:hypothetical protein
MALKAVSIQDWFASWKCWTRKLAEWVMLAEGAASLVLDWVWQLGVVAGGVFFGTQHWWCEWWWSWPLLPVLLAKVAMVLEVVGGKF